MKPAVVTLGAGLVGASALEIAFGRGMARWSALEWISASLGLGILAVAASERKLPPGVGALGGERPLGDLVLDAVPGVAMAFTGKQIARSLL